MSQRDSRSLAEQFADEPPDALLDMIILDLRAPLSSVLSCAHLLHEILSENSDESLEEARMLNQASAKSLELVLNIINALLEARKLKENADNASSDADNDH